MIERDDERRTLREFLARNPFPGPWTDGLFYREKMRAIHRIAPKGPVRRVLEVGGGRSGLAAQLYPNALIATVDIDASYGSLIDSHGYFVCANACALPFDDCKFDVVTLFDVLEHISDDTGAAREALRVTALGGSVLVTTPRFDWRYPYYKVLAPICPTEDELMSEWGHVRRGYRLEELEVIFEAKPRAMSSFINPLTALCHDIAFSQLSQRKRRLLHALAAPITMVGYITHNMIGHGAEIGAAWSKLR
jgi:SAM-dependent methyltransferase